MGRRKLTGTSIKVILDRKSELGSKSSTRACWPQLPIISPIRMIVNGSRKTNSAGLNCHLATRYKHAYEESSVQVTLNARLYFRLLTKYFGRSNQHNSKNRASYWR